MSPTLDQSAVLDALRSVKDPDLHKDIVTLGFVKDISTDNGRVSFTIELTTPACPVKDAMQEQARQVVAAIPGVTDVRVSMTAAVRAAHNPASQQAPIAGVKNIIAVGAGKGGVGKTTLAVNLAAALARLGGRVGIVDGDIYGPNIPMMLGIDSPLLAEGEKILPPEKHGLKVVSMGFLANADSPVIWRGPMLHSVIRQFFHDVKWGELDYLVIDMPPGTGDVALSLSQTVPVAGGIVVTTPQEVSLADSRRAVRMYQKLNIPVLGLVENMSYFVCPGCGHESDIFGRGGGERIAQELEVPFLGSIPIYQPIRQGGDTGTPPVITEPDSPAGLAFLSAAEQTAAQVSIASYRKAVIPVGVQR
jgi:ATP-binding protein involved in chromosome partitioning